MTRSFLLNQLLQKNMIANNFNGYMVNIGATSAE